VYCGGLCGVLTVCADVVSLTSVIFFLLRQDNSRVVGASLRARVATVCMEVTPRGLGGGETSVQGRRTNGTALRSQESCPWSGSGRVSLRAVSCTLLKSQTEMFEPRRGAA